MTGVVVERGVVVVGVAEVVVVVVAATNRDPVGDRSVGVMTLPQHVALCDTACEVTAVARPTAV